MGNMFPADFLWGAATAGYQVEGDICNNDWDFFTSARSFTRAWPRWANWRRPLSTSSSGRPDRPCTMRICTCSETIWTAAARWE